MGRRERQRKNSWINGGFIVITYEMMNSRAFKKLNSGGLKALIYCMRKVKIDDATDRFNYNFSFTFAEGKKLGLPNTSFCRAMAQLQDLGWLDCVERGGVVLGGLDRGNKKPTLYRLSRRWKEYGTPAYKKFHAGYCETVNAGYCETVNG